MTAVVDVETELLQSAAQVNAATAALAEVLPPLRARPGADPPPGGIPRANGGGARFDLGLALDALWGPDAARRGRGIAIEERTG